jgi:hypothetical protein
MHGTLTSKYMLIFACMCKIFREKHECLFPFFCIRVNVHFARSIRPIFTSFLLVASLAYPLNDQITFIRYHLANMFLLSFVNHL